ncbi:MAG: FAD-dependent oxidoreductase [Gammaproteobacteria bacterium]|nr:FAD-dependent oxidoreductase [Gammaproteobacteria bacterium]
MKSQKTVDVIILGGGISGLWTLNRLRQAGYNAILIESNRLGAGQTRYAQGIIHGGTKYALSGQMNAAAQAVSKMPARWRACLEGEGEIDLSEVKILSNHQYLWSTQKVTSRMAGFFASKLMRSRTASLKVADYPDAFKSPKFRGQLYQLDEPVLDTASLVEALAKPYSDYIFHIDSEDLKFNYLGGEEGWLLQSGEQQIKTGAIVITAGEGAEQILLKMGQTTPSMQRRPLHMVIGRGGGIQHPIFAHCLGASSSPRLTITSHRDGHGEMVWYLGGALSESGVGKSRDEQIETGRREVSELLPWIDFSKTEWSTLVVDRAEVKTSDGSRPENPYVDFNNRVITAWPTKLAFAPLLADQIMAQLKRHSVMPSEGEGALDLQYAEQAPLPWQEESRWSES